MFIDTKAEAKIAVEIAHRYGFTRLDIDSFYKRYLSNVFSAWASDDDARGAQAEIFDAVESDREAKRRPTREELTREAQQERERVAHDISARTGENYTDVLRRL